MKYQRLFVGRVPLHFGGAFVAFVVSLLTAIIGSAPCVNAAGLSSTSSPQVREIETARPDSGPPVQDLPYQPPIATEAAPVERDPVMESQYQLQLLHRDVMEVRGILEELKFELARVKAIQEDRYLELDSRLQELLKSRVETWPQRADTGGVADPDTAKTTTANANLDEKSLYDTSLQLIRNRQYDLAITQLESLIARFPDSQVIANAYYWLGEVYAAKQPPDYEKARQALAQVITFFPDHRKVPDAAFKLGKVYYLLGDCERAVELLKGVSKQHAGKSVAKLADTYLHETVQCDS